MIAVRVGDRIHLNKIKILIKQLYVRGVEKIEVLDPYFALARLERKYCTFDLNK